MLSLLTKEIKSIQEAEGTDNYISTLINSCSTIDLHFKNGDIHEKLKQIFRKHYLDKLNNATIELLELAGVKEIQIRTTRKNGITYDCPDMFFSFNGISYELMTGPAGLYFLEYCWPVRNDVEALKLAVKNFFDNGESDDWRRR